MYRLQLTYSPKKKRLQLNLQLLYGAEHNFLCSLILYYVGVVSQKRKKKLCWSVFQTLKLCLCPTLIRDESSRVFINHSTI